MKSYFITGTDTDCGKTYSTCELISYLQAQHQTVLALKPVASGCYEVNGQLISDDAVKLAARQPQVEPSDLCAWPMRLPISPHLAAKVEQIKLSSQDIIAFCINQASFEPDIVLIEGAGGLMAPINETETWIDVLKASEIPVILTVGLRLGCLNHALLTISALERYEISCVGWIANCLDQDMHYLNENIQTLVNKISPPLLGTIQFGQSFVPGKQISLLL